VAGGHTLNLFNNKIHTGPTRSTSKPSRPRLAETLKPKFYLEIIISFVDQTLREKD